MKGRPVVERRVKRLANTKELAEYIGATPAAIKQRIYIGKLPFPYSKDGKKLVFDLEKVDAWIDKLPEYGGVNLLKD